MSVEVRLAAEYEADIVANLMSLYLFEQAPRTGRQIAADGAYRYNSLDRFWTDPGCYPFLIWSDGELAGFALVAQRDRFDPGEKGSLIAEFFILPTYRRKGIGQAAAGLIFGLFPGQWWIPQPMWNQPAQAFWRAVVARYSGGAFREEAWSWQDEDGIAQIFTVPERSAG